MDNTGHNLFSGKHPDSYSGLQSNMTGQMSDRTLKQSLDEMIDKMKEESGKPFIPIPNDPVWIVSPKQYEQMESEGYVKDGELTELGMKHMAGLI